MEVSRAHVSVPEFESTAIEKLVARGIREDIARSFVSDGLRKTNGYDRYKDVVCKPRFQGFFVHHAGGHMVPTVLKRTSAKFKAPFSMTGREKAELIASFPELDVICDGIVRNPHSLYANKRLAETELIVMAIWAYAIKHGGLDATSVVDLGGNEMFHRDRGRNNVHCDTPIISAKDIMRYTIREVYGGSDSSARCLNTFQKCDVRKDFGMAVHATYDLTPTQIASAMHSRGMKAFFGVLNIYPAISHLSDGEFIHDGIRLAIKGDAVRYSFVHDATLEYVHSKTILQSYLVSQYSIPIVRDGVTTYYNFRHMSVRGATVMFSIIPDEFPIVRGTSISTGMRYNKYSISLEGLTDSQGPIEVDCELFDRLVLMASASRKFDEYNITALYKYAKSLRQRISINSIVLSSGFRERTQVLVWLTIAAMAVAVSFHVSSVEYFKQASSEILFRRSRGLWKDVVEITSAMVLQSAQYIFSASGGDSILSDATDLIKQKLRGMSSVKVSVATVKDFGNEFDPSILGPLTVQAGNPNYDDWFTLSAQSVKTSEHPSDQMNYIILDYSSRISGSWELGSTVLASYGVKSVYQDSLAIRRVLSRPALLSTPIAQTPGSKQYALSAYNVYISSLNLGEASNGRPRRLTTGDYVLHIIGGVNAPGSTADHRYIAFRGAGDKFVECEPPSYYSSKCDRFILFYTHDITGHVISSRVGSETIEHLPNPLYSVIRQADAALMRGSQSFGVVYNSPSKAGSGLSVQCRDDGSSSDARAGAFYNHRPVYTATGTVVPTPDAWQSIIEDIDDGLESRGSVRNSPSVAPSNTVSSGPAASSSDDPFFLVEPREAQSVAPPLSQVPSSPSVLPELPESPELSIDGSNPVAATASTDEFKRLLNLDEPREQRRTWGSEMASVDGESSVPGSAAISEMIKWAEEQQKVALAYGATWIPFAREAADGKLSQRQWHGISQGVEGSPCICLVSGGVLVDFYTGELVRHMAVTDGSSVYARYDVLSNEDSVYITYSDLEIWVSDAIIRRASSRVFDDYSCDVINIRGPAGCGKTTDIVNAITEDDLGLCETRFAAKDTIARLRKKFSNPKSIFCTASSFIINRNATIRPRVLYIDEALRIHAGIIWLLIKIIKPGLVMCYGDPAQIPVLPFTPSFDFMYAQFPFTRVETKAITYRLPADVTALLCEAGYYDYKFKTHNSVQSGCMGIKQYYVGIFKEKTPDVCVLTYTRAASEDLRRDGVTNVMTIGESQGKDIDHVWLYRDSPLAKDIYFDKSQTLTAITRVKKTFLYVSAVFDDDCNIAVLLKQLEDPVLHAKIPSYMADSSVL